MTTRVEKKNTHVMENFDFILSNRPLTPTQINNLQWNRMTLMENYPSNKIKLIFRGQDTRINRENVFKLTHFRTRNRRRRSRTVRVDLLS